MRHVIIGNSAAGIFAAEEIRRLKPEDKIIILSDEKEPAYSRCLTSYYIAGKVEEENMRIRTKNFYHDLNIEFYPGEKVMEADVSKMFLKTSSGKVIDYDRLLVASGARAVQPDLDGGEGTGVFTLRTLSDARGIVERCKKTDRAVVAGGGLVSLKATYGLMARGLKVTVVIASGQILSQVLDDKAAGLIQKHLEKHHVEFIFGHEVMQVILDEEHSCQGVKLDDGTELSCGLVVIGKGVIPNTDFLNKDEVEIGQGIKVDQNLKTSADGVYAAGDVAESFDFFNAKSALYAIWPNATAQGQIAGSNMAGEKMVYEGALSMNSMNFFGLNAICAGESRARGSGFDISFEYDPQNNYYRKFVFHQELLAGYILVGNVARAGILTGMIGQKISPPDCAALLKNGVASLGI
ncbi:MAG: NAD(P)/FAD-dependent oxidoreductase [Peptococcaceae bacterium]|nr:NAD(P)/FAD-dependent oxidoreductase [Peptococcaceae bacterium]